MAGDIVAGTDLDQLPHTTRSNIPYEILWESTRERWANGEGVASFEIKQKWNDSYRWLRDMAGEVTVEKQSQSAAYLYLRRYVPEKLDYGDDRFMFAMDFQQTSSGGTPRGQNFANVDNKWPEPQWIRYLVGFQTPIFQIRNGGEVGTLENEIVLIREAAQKAGNTRAFSEPTELLRYMHRQRKNSAREQPIPIGVTGEGFKTIELVNGKHQVIPSALSFKAVAYADVAYTWYRIPVAWPPPAGWTAPAAKPYWPSRFNPKGASPATVKYARDAFVLTVNDDWFDTLDPEGYCFAPGELLYLGYDDNHRYRDVVGDAVADVVYYFRYKANGWNKYLSSLGLFYEVSSDGTETGIKPYKKQNFNDLFQYRAAPIVA